MAKRNVIIFGMGKMAEVVHSYMAEDNELEVSAFTCDKEYIETNSWKGMPVVPFEVIQEQYPPEKYVMFVALGYQELNSFRANTVGRAKEKGYTVISFIHRDSRLPKDVEVGENCLVTDNVCIQPKVRLGNNVFVWNGAMVGGKIMPLSS